MGGGPVTHSAHRARSMNRLINPSISISARSDPVEWCFLAPTGRMSDGA